MTVQQVDAPRMTPPIFRGVDFVVLLPRDPDWGIAFWEVTSGSCASLTEAARSWRPLPVLRLYTLPARGESTRTRRHVAEYVLDSWVGSRLVLLGPPGSRQQAVIGLASSEGAFRPLCRSTPFQSPRTRVDQAVSS